MGTFGRMLGFVEPRAKCSQDHDHSTAAEAVACDEQCKTSTCTLNTGNMKTSVEHNSAFDRKRCEAQVTGYTGLNIEQTTGVQQQMIGTACRVTGVPRGGGCGTGQAAIQPGVLVKINGRRTFIELSKARQMSITYEEDDVEDGTYVQTPGGLKFMAVSQVQELGLTPAKVETSSALAHTD